MLSTNQVTMIEAGELMPKEKERQQCTFETGEEKEVPSSRHRRQTERDWKRDLCGGEGRHRQETAEERELHCSNRSQKERGD